jgi:hypothetical protein
MGVLGSLIEQVLTLDLEILSLPLYWQILWGDDAKINRILKRWFSHLCRERIWMVVTLQIYANGII